MGGFLQTIGRLLTGGRRPDPRMVRTPPFLPGPDNDPANVSGWGPERLDQITGRALDAQWRGAPILQPPSITTPSFIPGDQNLEAVSQPQERRPTLIPPQASGPGMPPPRNEVPRQPLSPPQDITSPPPRTQGLVDLNPQVLQDRASDYSGQRRTIQELPRQGDYEPGKGRKALSLLTGIAANVMRGNPRSFAAGAIAPTLDTVSGMIRDRGYNKAMQAHKENSQVAEGLAGTSQNELLLEDKLATGQSQRQNRELQAQVAEMKARTADQARKDRQVTFANRRQAEAYGLPPELLDKWDAEGWDEPITMDRTSANTLAKAYGADRVAATRKEGYITVNKQKRESMEKIAKETEEGKNFRQQLDLELKRDEGAANRKSREGIAAGKNATTLAATSARVGATDRRTNVVEKMAKLKTDATLKLDAAIQRGMKDAESALSDGIRKYTPGELQKLAAQGDESAAARLHHYNEWISELQKMRNDRYTQIEQEYQGALGSLGDEDQAPTATPSRPAPARKPTSPAPARRPLNQIIQVK